MFYKKQNTVPMTSHTILMQILHFSIVNTFSLIRCKMEEKTQWFKLVRTIPLHYTIYSVS